MNFNIDKISFSEYFYLCAIGLTTKVLKYISLNDCGGHYDAISGCPRFFCPFLYLEGVADSEVKAKAVFELRYIVVAAFSCVVWCVQGNPQIESDNQKRQVIT